MEMFILGQIPFINTEVYQRVLSKMMGGLDIAWITGLVSAFLLYFIAVKVTANAEARSRATVRLPNK